MVENPIEHVRVKHIEIDYHFICDMVLKKKLDIQYCHTNEQLANILTKPLIEENIQGLISKLIILPRP